MKLLCKNKISKDNLRRRKTEKFAWGAYFNVCSIAFCKGFLRNWIQLLSLLRYSPMQISLEINPITNKVTSFWVNMPRLEQKKTFYIYLEYLHPSFQFLCSCCSTTIATHTPNIWNEMSCILQWSVIHFNAELSKREENTAVNKFKVDIEPVAVINCSLDRVCHDWIPAL